MNRICFFCIALLSISSISNAQQNDKFQKDLEKLREEHKEAIERAMDPVNKRYIHEFETLLKRSTFDGDLNTAVKVKRELERLRGQSNSIKAASPFVGQWEYEYSGKTYRRMIRADGSVELWRSGSLWKKSSGDPYWVGFTWKPAGDDKIEIRNSKGGLYLIWTLQGSDEILQTDVSSGKKEKFKRGKDEWK